LNDYHCVLPPGARITYANLSSICPRQNIPPFWQAQVSLSETENIIDQPKINVNIRLSFNGEQQELYVERQLFIAIKNCSEK